MQPNKRNFILFLAVPLAVGGLSVLFTGGGFSSYAVLEKPPFSPPGWLFPVVWTALYLLMGYSSYLVAITEADRMDKALAFAVYTLQLLANFAWPIFFFRLELRLSAFVLLLLLGLLVTITIALFWSVRRFAGKLLIPYFLWICYAGYLNFGIFLRN